MRVADNTNDQACSRRILSDFGRHNKHLKYFFQSHVFCHDVSRLTFSPVYLLQRLSQRSMQGAWDKREARELETSEKRERGMMGTSALHEGGVMESKTGEERKANLLVASFFSPCHRSFRPGFPQ